MPSFRHACPLFVCAIFSWLATGALAATVHGRRQAPMVSINGPPAILDGARPGIRISGLASRSQVTVESWRIARAYVTSPGGRVAKDLLFHASADFWADRAGRLDLDHAAPLTGSYSGADPRGLLWSGTVALADPAADALADKTVRFRVRVGGVVVATRDIRILPWAANIRFTQIATSAVTGVFAAPALAHHAPTLIVLHGSEGGDFESARRVAGRFASRGYATLALVYFVWPGNGITTVPQGFSQLPVERLVSARNWLAKQPAADARRLALVGASKGAEFALIGAATYPWVRGVVGCVPSSVVWGGFGAGDRADPPSFLRGSHPLAAIPYGDYGPVSRGEITSAERHRRDRAAADPDLVAHSSIPVERSSARLLLISGGRDAVWPSDAMSAEIAARMAAYGKGNQVEWRSFPDAGHYLCGTGSAPIRVDESDEAARGGGTLAADGRDPGTAWEETLVFLRRLDKFKVAYGRSKGS